MTACFGQTIWIPHAVIEGGQLIMLYDAAFHHVVEDSSEGLLRQKDYDRRWLRIRRPSVVVGGELTLANLEIHCHPQSNINEAPLQMKSNGGCLLVDDFGRQRIAPNELLNRWIIPLECRHDFLTLANGSQDSSAVRAIDHLLDEPGAGRAGRRGFFAANRLQD